MQPYSTTEMATAWKKPHFIVSDFHMVNMEKLVSHDQQKFTLTSFLAGTGCHLEDLPKAMDKRDKWQEKTKGIYAESTLNHDKINAFLLLGYKLIDKPKVC